MNENDRLHRQRTLLGGERSVLNSAAGRLVVRGRSTNRYRIVLDDTSRAALSSLPASQLAWFDLEHPGDATVIEVDVSSDLIVRIDVQMPRHLHRDPHLRRRLIL
jgi:hypothetical protein